MEASTGWESARLERMTASLYTINKKICIRTFTLREERYLHHQMWNVEEIVKINKDSEHGWGWLRLGFTEATVYQLQAAEATTWPYWPPRQHSCRGHRESLRY